MTRFIMWGAVAGLTIPVIILILHFLKVSHHIPDYLKLILWPSSIMTLGVQGADSVVAMLFVATSIALNVGLYAAIGALVWRAQHIFK
jgi:hypothetical protein